MQTDHYITASGIEVARQTLACSYLEAGDALIDRLDQHRGAYYCSSFEYPGRYTRWDMGFSDPMLALSSRERQFCLQALNPRGQLLLSFLYPELAVADFVTSCVQEDERISGHIVPAGQAFSEEERSRQPSVFSLLRWIQQQFASPADNHLGLYGAFAYDLVFQFEPMPLHQQRAEDQRDLLLYLPDELLLIDHFQRRASLLRYTFSYQGKSTTSLDGGGQPAPWQPIAETTPAPCDHADGDYQQQVRNAKAFFARGDLFEVVPGQLFSEPCPHSPASVFRRLRTSNPAPYGALINLGEGEFLVAASPEMFIRVEGRRIESCPISGTIARGRTPLEDAEQIRILLNSSKDEAELTMCTDVDRNDKSRVCEPDSVRVIGRRQVELYSRLIHTVDHVEGHLQSQFDALDGFLSHMWAVTVTGAPKRAAIAWIEQYEHSARRWYGGAIGCMTFNGNMNTGLTLRTVRMKQGIAEVRAGATLLFDSDPQAEDAETRLKASALMAVIRSPATASIQRDSLPQAGQGLRVLLVDHEDSFVHTLSAYLRRTGAEVQTLRAGLARERLTAGFRPDLVLLSPGPGRPDDFGLRKTLDLLIQQQLPTFGVCLGLQGIAEYFGGQLGQLAEPMHGKVSTVSLLASRIFDGLPASFAVGRYHSLHAARDSLPDCLQVVMQTEEQTIMALEHRSLPIAAVQFHPESIMTMGVGQQMVEQALLRLVAESMTGKPV